MSGSSGKGVRRRVLELVTSLSVYRQLHGIRDLELDYIRRVEEAQAEAMERVRRLAEGAGSLVDLVDRLASEGLLLEIADLIAVKAGLERPSRAGREEVARVLSGDVDFPGGRAILLALQAAARSYAEAVLEREGPASRVSNICPLCGAASETMYRRRGSHYMVCHFCGYTWRVSGEVPACPRCSATPPLDVGIVSDKSRRLGLARCGRCGYTWRIILDEHVRAPLIALPLIALGAERFRGAVEAAGLGDVEDHEGGYEA